MFSKEESAKLRKEFWVSYGKSFPRKWILYNTKIKDFSFKFTANTKYAEVSLDIESNDATLRELLYDQVMSLKKILETEYVPNIIFDQNYQLPNGKQISRIYIQHTQKFSIHNKATWSNCFTFFNQNMSQLELFWFEYQDYIAQANLK